MLLEFRVGNFLSFDDVQTIRTSDLRQTTEGTVFGPCVPLMLLYGPNSSGKSNLLRAASFARDMLLAADRGFRDLRYGAYRGSPSEKDSYFEFVIRTDRTYAVGFEMDLGTHIIKHEWLYVLGEDGDRCVYDEKGFDGPPASRLNDAAQSGIPEAESVSSWLRDSLFIVTDDNMTLDVPVGDGFLHTLGTALSRLDTHHAGGVFKVIRNNDVTRDILHAAPHQTLDGADGVQGIGRQMRHSVPTDGSAFLGQITHDGGQEKTPFFIGQHFRCSV